jgi:capsular exopolysaccharide synthesis family protein
MVTSTSPKEGKTTVATNLAITMAQAGYRVLLIDADLRKPMVHEVFGLDNEHGLSTLLGEAGEARVYIRKTEVENLHVLPGGPEPVNPAELLGSRKMRTLIAETSERYDVVVLDSSPVLGVADANILATMMDAVVLVIQASKAKRGHVVRARNQLLGVNARVVGAVLNNVRGLRGDYYYYRRYYTPTQIRSMAEQRV